MSFNIAKTDKKRVVIISGVTATHLVAIQQGSLLADNLKRLDGVDAGSFTFYSGDQE